MDNEKQNLVKSRLSEQIPKVQQIIAQTEEQIKVLEMKFASGEISQKDYTAQKKQLNSALSNLKSSLNMLNKQTKK